MFRWLFVYCIGMVVKSPARATYTAHLHRLLMLMHSTATRQEGPHDHVNQRQVFVTVIAIIANRFLRDLLLDLHLQDKTTSDLKAKFQQPSPFERRPFHRLIKRIVQSSAVSPITADGDDFNKVVVNITH